MVMGIRHVLLFVLTAALGISGIAAAAHLGRPWQLAEVIYDLGIALLIIAVIELLLFRVLRELSARKTEMEKIAAELEASNERSRRTMVALDQSMRDIKLDNVFTTLHKMDALITQKLDDIAKAITKVQPPSPGPSPPNPTHSKP